ncbi:TPA: hypothetical protein ACOEHG_000896 [Enterobacter ludwigii]
MSVELKVFGGAYFPKDKALKKTPYLKPLVITIKSTTRAIAEAVMFGKLAAEHPEHIDDFFKIKIWEHREGLPCPEFDVFTSDFFDTIAVWNVNAGEPATLPESDIDGTPEEDKSGLELKAVARLDQTSRAACLALFGSLAEITAAQYGQVVDLINDDAGSFTRELAEALTKESRSLALAPERQEQMLAWVRENAKESAQWPDIKKLIARWIDVPADKRPQANSRKDNYTDSGVTLGGGNLTDRSPDLVHNLSTLRIEVAIAILSMFDEIDIYSIPNKFLSPAKSMAEAEQDPCFTAWWKKLRGTPGVLDYSRAAIIALIKSAPEDLWTDPVALRAYINRELVESDHANPDQKTIKLASNPRPREAPEKRESKESLTAVQNKEVLPVVCPGRSAQLEKELNEAFSDQLAPEQHQQVDDKPEAVNPPLPEESEKAAEQHAAATSELQTNVLTYSQHLTLAALQGLCANPAHGTSFDDIADMAVQLAAGVVRIQESHSV